MTRTLPRAPEVLSLVTEHERAVKRVLHRQVIEERSLTAKWLASATGYTENTVYKHLDEDTVNTLSLRTVGAVLLGSKAARRSILDLLGGLWGVRWRELPRAVGSAAEVRALVCKALECSARASAQALQDLADGAVSPSELEVTRPMLLESVRLQQELLAQLERESERPDALRVVS